MKVAFISDIHGNAIALETVIEDLKQKKADKVYVLGDLCYRGPEPRRSLELVRSLHTEVIKGNADEWVVRGVREGEVPGSVLDMMNREREWTVSQLAASDMEYLQGLPEKLELQIEGVAISAFHATPESLFDIILPNANDDVLKSKLMSSADSRIFIYAHIHKPFIRYLEGQVIMNIGSVGLPFDGLPKASYGMVEIKGENIRTSIERVSYEIEAVVDKYIETGYPNAEMMTRVVRQGRI